MGEFARFEHWAARRESMDSDGGTLVPKPFGPLQGVRIVSTGTLVAQPFAAHLAALFGAEVVQVEHPSGTCDPWRVLDSRMPTLAGGEVATCWVQERRNAFYVTLDLSTPEGRELFLRLLGTRDIWMESSKPGTFQRWGLGDAVVQAAHPSLVITHVSGYGQSGHADYLGRASYDMIGQAFGGMMHLTGFADPEPPVRAVPYTGDYITALFALWSSLAAYIHRQRTGRGQVIDVAQYEAVHQLLGGTMVQYFSSGVVRQRAGNKSPSFQPYDAFRANDGWVVLGAYGPVFDRVCRVIGADPAVCAAAATRVDTPEGVAFDARLRGWIADRPVAQVVDAFNRASVPCCPVMTAEDMANDPHYGARGMHVEWDDPQVGRVRGTGATPHFSETPGAVWRGSVPAGNDNALIYRDLLGVPDGELAVLRERRVI
jgi:crotonobetainyl-CoA:carnitine CoA-transferase CaiB-like acyl-CoA transferase